MNDDRGAWLTSRGFGWRVGARGNVFKCEIFTVFLLEIEKFDGILGFLGTHSWKIDGIVDKFANSSFLRMGGLFLDRHGFL